MSESYDQAYVEDGKLILKAEKIGNEYRAGGIESIGKVDFTFGRVEVRARIPRHPDGAFPAIWLMPQKSAPLYSSWPNGGEIDIMEYYPVNGVPQILGNVASGAPGTNNAYWKDKKVPFSHFLEKDPDWASKFHIWRMDWDRDWIRLYLDDELINEVDINQMQNTGSWSEYNPHRHPHYILLNLALGGASGGPIDDSAFPMRYEIDYVRVYQR